MDAVTKEPVKAWKAPVSTLQYLWFEGDNGDRYLAPPSHLHGHYDARRQTLTLSCGEDRITIKGPNVLDLVESLGSGRAQGVRANGADLTSVVIVTEQNAAADRVLQASTP
jgi:hypothetical protein